MDDTPCLKGLGIVALTKNNFRHCCVCLDWLLLTQQRYKLFSAVITLSHTKELHTKKALYGAGKETENIHLMKRYSTRKKSREHTAHRLYAPCLYRVGLGFS